MFQITNHFLHEQKTKLLIITRFSVKTNLASEVTIQQMYLLFLNNKTLRGFDNRPYPTMILIDLQKEFGTV